MSGVIQTSIGGMARQQKKNRSIVTVHQCNFEQGLGSRNNWLDGSWPIGAHPVALKYISCYWVGSRKSQFLWLAILLKIFFWESGHDKQAMLAKAFCAIKFFASWLPNSFVYETKPQSVSINEIQIYLGNLSTLAFYANPILRNIAVSLNRCFQKKSS